MELSKIQALWSFATSDLFDDRERAALHFALAAGSSPSAVDAEHHAALREHFTDEEVRTLLGVVALSGFMNRYNDALATVTDAESADWAAANLGPLGWDIGKHIGADHEQRSGPLAPDTFPSEVSAFDSGNRLGLEQSTDNVRVKTCRRCAARRVTSVSEFKCSKTSASPT